MSDIEYFRVFIRICFAIFLLVLISVSLDVKLNFIFLIFGYSLSVKELGRKLNGYLLN